jgi:pimeloyl-ACP methyl ester carboxylesterase
VAVSSKQALGAAFTAIKFLGTGCANPEIYDSPADFLARSPVATELHGGRMLELPLGRVHMVEVAPTTAATNIAPILAIHGFSGNTVIWERNLGTFAALSTAVAVDLLGRGLSERRDDYAYDKDMYVEQIRQIADVLGYRRVNLVGLSMGGAISIAFAARYPDRVQTLTVINSAGMPFEVPALSHMVSRPGVGEFLGPLMSTITAKQTWYSMLHDQASADEGFRRRFAAPWAIRGSQRALLGTLRRMDLHGAAPELAILRARRLPMLMTWGMEDTLIPQSTFDAMQTHYPEASTLLLAGAGHVANFEGSAAFNVGWREWVESAAR